MPPGPSSIFEQTRGMTDSNISSELREFLADHVRTYEQLEILLLMAAEAERSWTARSMSEALKIPYDLAVESLQALAEKSVLQASPTSEVVFRVSSAEAQRHIRSLAEVYSENRLLVMQLLNENALRRMRTDAVRAFSRAFLIRGKKDG